jgi:hypothetical protein
MLEGTHDLVAHVALVEGARTWRNLGFRSSSCGFGDALERDGVDAGQQQLHQSDDSSRHSSSSRSSRSTLQASTASADASALQRSSAPTSARYVMSTSLPSTSANAFRVSAEGKNVTTT